MKFNKIFIKTLKIPLYIQPFMLKKGSSNNIFVWSVKNNTQGPKGWGMGFACELTTTNYLERVRQTNTWIP